jgi:hypothetical protein
VNRTLIFLLFTAATAHAQSANLDPATMPRLGSVDERFQSYNVEMVEVTGGRFWKPYKSTADAPASPGSGAPAGLNPNLFEYRPPIDLSNPRLRILAAALAPAYVRVSGTWANSTWFQDSDAPAPATPPAGFNSVLTRKEWKGVLDFAQVTHAGLVTSFAIGAGTRDAAGVWTPAQAQSLLSFTQTQGGHIGAAEFMNEPTFAAIGGAPKGYDAAAFARDLAVFEPVFRKQSPGSLLLGPGSVGEGPVAALAGVGVTLKSEDLLKATGPVFDGFSYHIYGGVSQRCAPPGSPMNIAADSVLSPDWLTRSAKINAYYAGLRDRDDAGKPLWVTETADAACGGNPWAATFLDTFRYLVQHGSLAQQGVQVILHNTLASSDYGLLDEKSDEPRPNYWAALAWRRLMGTTVLNPAAKAQLSAANVYLYAHCLSNHPGGVAVLIVNADRQQPFHATIPLAGVRYTLTAEDLQSPSVQLNGKTLQLDDAGSVPDLIGAKQPAGDLTVAPTSIEFIAIPTANNAACQQKN